MCGCYSLVGYLVEELRGLEGGANLRTSDRDSGSNIGFGQLGYR